MNKFVRKSFILLCMTVSHLSVAFEYDTAAMMQELQGGPGSEIILVEDKSSQGFDGIGSGGKLDNLLSAAGEIPGHMKPVERWGVGPWSGYWGWDEDPLEKQTCDKDGENCKKSAAPTAQEIVKKRVARIEGILKIYALKGEDAISELARDMKALQEQINQLSVRKLNSSGEHLKTELQRILEAAQMAKTMMVKQHDKQLFEAILKDYAPSSHDLLLEDSMKDIEKKIEYFYRDQVMRQVYEKVKDRLYAIQRVVESIKKTNDSLEEARNLAQEKLQRLKSAASSARGLSQAQKQAQQDEIALYIEVVAELGLEIKKEEKVLAALSNHEVSAKDLVAKKYNYTMRSGEYLRLGVAELAKIQDELEFVIEDAKRDLAQLAKELDRITVGSLKVQKKEEIKKQEIAIQLLEKDLKELKDVEILQERKLEELVRKHGSVKQAIEYLKKSGASLVDAKSMIEILEKRQKKAEKDAKANDPFNKAVEALAKAKVADVPQALENVIVALLAKSGVTMDKIDVNKRQELALVLKNTSDKLIAIIQNPYLSEQRKQQEKQEIVKGMLKDVSILLGSSLTGASTAALATGNLQVIATDMALNKLINALVPEGIGQSSSGFNLDGFNTTKKQGAYATLGLQEGVTRDEVRKAYRDLALKTHPDKRPASERDVATLEMQKIQEAYEELMKDF